MPFCDDRSTKRLACTSSSGRSSGRSGAQPHLLHHDGDRVRQLVADALQGGLADQVGDDRLLRGVGELARRGRAPAPRAAARRSRSVSRPTWSPLTADTGTISAQSVPVSVPSAAMSSRCWASRSGGTRSVLVATATFDRTPHLGELLDEEPVARADLLVGREADRDHVDLGPGAGHQVVEPLPQQRPRPVQPRGVDQDQLGVGPVHDAAHHGAGGLRPRRGDRDLGADQCVGQRRLAGVGPADEAGEAAAEGGGRLVGHPPILAARRPARSAQPVGAQREVGTRRRRAASRASTWCSWMSLISKPEAAAGEVEPPHPRRAHARPRRRTRPSASARLRAHARQVIA